MRFPWQREETELDDELGFHLEQLAAKYESEGMAKKEALRRARSEFGVMEKVKDECRDESRWKWLAELRQDIAFGWRMLRKTPVVTAAAVLSLALGIGSGTAIFSLMNTLMWQDLGVPQPEQLSFVWWRSQGRFEGIAKGMSGTSYREGSMRVSNMFSYPSFEKIREKAAGRAEIAGYLYKDQVSVSYQGQTAVVQGRPVSGGFFSVLRVKPYLGRVLIEADDRENAPAVVVVSYEFWKKQMGGKREALGQVIRMNRYTFEVVGVLPPDFGGISIGDATDLYVSFRQSPEVLGDTKFYSFTNAENWWVELVARRAPGQDAEGLKTYLDEVFRSSWAGTVKDEATAPHIHVLEGRNGVDGVRRSVEKPLYVIFGLVGLLLLIACANIANLQLARAEARRKEVALRISLGCAQRRLLRQFLTESMLLAGLGGVASLGFAWITANLLLVFVPGGGKDLRVSVPLDGWLLAATLGISVLTVLLFGVFPAWRATQVDAGPALKEGSGSVGGAARSWWTPGKVLLVAQIAVALVLTVSAALFTQNLRRIWTRDTGFERSRLLLFELSPGQIGYQGERLKTIYRQVEESIVGLPGVQSAGLAQLRPMSHRGSWGALAAVGSKKNIDVSFSKGSGGYFEAIGIKLLAGRAIGLQDVAQQTKVAVVSETLARQLSTEMKAGTYPLGMPLQVDGDGPSNRFQIIGVAADAAYSSQQERPSVLYAPSDMQKDSMAMVVRTTVAPMQVLPRVREAIRKLDPNLPMIDVQTMDEQIAEGLQTERMFAYLCGGFGVLSLAMLVVGLYGVMAYATARRQNEMGIRMALGATQGQVLGLVLGDGMRLVLLGFLVGAPLLWYGAKFVEQFLFEMKGWDPASLVSAAGVLGLAAFLATLVPAWRAAVMDPHTALRRE
jgi:predicted permease